jgi:hypothetical protein
MSKFVGTGPSSYKKRIYRAAVSQRLRTTALNGLFSSGFRTKTVYAIIISLMRATCPAHTVLFDLMTLLILLHELSKFNYHFPWTQLLSKIGILPQQDC